MKNNNHLFKTARIIISTFLVVASVLLWNPLSAHAADGVPSEVMEATKSVVRILSEYSDGYATGTGFVIKNQDAEVLVATNNHVVADNPICTSIWIGEDELIDAEIVFTTPDKDLAVLRINEPLDLNPVLLSTEDAQHGAAIYAVGFPGDADILSDSIAYTSDSATITDGIISAIRTFTIEEGAEPVKLLQINAAINHGNSGGPLFDSSGTVIGVNTYGITSAQGIFAAVDIHELHNMLQFYNIDISNQAEETQPPTETIQIPSQEETSGTSPILFLFVIVFILLAAALLYILRHKHSPTKTIEGKMVSDDTEEIFITKHRKKPLIDTSLTPISPEENPGNTPEDFSDEIIISRHNKRH